MGNMNINLLTLFVILGCFNADGVQTNKQSNTQSSNLGIKSDIDTSALVLKDRFQEPDSFKRLDCDTNSFAFYLRHLKLKPYGSKVKYFDGTYKYSEDVYCAVVDMEISNKDLQQCADAVIRLRSEYLFSKKKYDSISFRFLGDGKMHSYKDYAGSDRSYAKFRKYTEYVFSYANTASLHKQLKTVEFADMQIGDVFIQKGVPYGHAVIVIDMCIDGRGNKKYMLAQSYMPAQETQILRNPKDNSAWYGEPEGIHVKTPEWSFTINDLKRW